MVGQILTLILVLGIIPLCVGMIPVNLMEKRHRSLGVTYIAGETIDDIVHTLAEHADEELIAALGIIIE